MGRNLAHVMSIRIPRLIPIRISAVAASVTTEPRSVYARATQADHLIQVVSSVILLRQIHY